MAYIQGEGRSQATLFPVVLDDLVPADHICRVIGAFVEQLDMEKLGFGRAQPADTGRPATILAHCRSCTYTDICTSFAQRDGLKRNAAATWK
jgi:transposase